MALQTMTRNDARAQTARSRYVSDTVETVSPAKLVTMLTEQQWLELIGG